MRQNWVIGSLLQCFYSVNFFLTFKINIKLICSAIGLLALFDASVFQNKKKNTYHRVASTYLLVYFFLTVIFLRKAFLFSILDVYSFSCGSVRMNV